MSPIDLLIVIVYLIGLILVGLYFQKKASEGIDNYFLGGRSIPWWVLGASGMASNFDVTGTMINTALIFAVGASGFFIEIRGGVTLIMAFLLAFMGKWNRRALVMTIAEWMKFRFGEKRDGQIARIIGALSQIIFTIAMVTYFSVGAGKFLAEFFGIPPLFGMEPRFIAALFLIVLSTIYTVASGLYGVVWTDVFQSFFVFFTLVTISFLAFYKYPLPDTFYTSYPLINHEMKVIRVNTLSPDQFSIRDDNGLSMEIEKEKLWSKLHEDLKIKDTVIIIQNSELTGPETIKVPQPQWKEYLSKVPDDFEIHFPSRYQLKEVKKESWANIFPAWKLNFPKNSDYSIFNLFGIAILFYLVKVCFEGSGGTGGYMIQRYFAAKSDRDAGLLSAFWTFLLSFRWLFIVAISMMGISYFMNSKIDLMLGTIDPERVLPIVINQMIPVGLKGLLIAGLMAAAMSTFDSTVNAGAAYWVKDIYQSYINPKASEKQLIWHSRIASVLIVLIGLLFSITIKNINEIWGWITMALGSGLLIPFLARWYWWRLNGYGFSAGVLSGIIAAVIQKFFFPYAPEYYSFISVNFITAVSMILFTYITPPTEEKVLRNFYSITRPFGLWKKFRDELPNSEQNVLKEEHRTDILALIIAIPLQLTLFLTWMTFISRNWFQFTIVLLLTIIFAVILYFIWFKKLNKFDISPISEKQ